jgi:hypothetical protein
MKKSCWLILAALMGLCINLGCGIQLSSDCRQLCSSKQKDEAFLSQPLKRQIDLYLDCTCKEDSITADYRFSKYIAKNGKEAIPYLMERLKSEEDENKQLKIISVFSQMTPEDLRGRQDVADLVNQTVAKMNGSFLSFLEEDRNKQYAMELAKGIELNSKESERR